MFSLKVKAKYIREKNNCLNIQNIYESMFMVNNFDTFKVLVGHSLVLLENFKYIKAYISLIQFHFTLYIPNFNFSLQKFHNSNNKYFPL